MSHFMPPALLALFAPRPPPEFKPPIEKGGKQQYTGIAEYVDEFVGKDELPPIEEFETPQKRKERVKKEKAEAHKKVLEERAKNWDPHKNTNATKDPFKTLFVARLPYEMDEDALKHEFSRYGSIRDVKLIRDLQGKSRGYAFIEYKESRHLKEAFQRADGMRLKGRRILVDVERGRTVPRWKPRKLGGGLGSTRAASKGKGGGSGGSGGSGRDNGNDKNGGTRDESVRYRERRDRYKDGDLNDRDRRRSHHGRERSRSRSRTRSRSRHRSRRSHRDRDRDRDRDRERERERESRQHSDKTRDKEKEKEKENNEKDRNKERERERERDRHSSRHDRDRSRKDKKDSGEGSTTDRDKKDGSRGSRKRERGKSKEKHRR